MYAQIIDDQSAETLVEASSLSKNLREKVGSKGGNREGAAMVGTAIAQRAISKGIKQVVFDRGGYRYHGRVAALAAGARDAGIEF